MKVDSDSDSAEKVLEEKDVSRSINFFWVTLLAQLQQQQRKMNGKEK
jgi:hypothetical protein